MRRDRAAEFPLRPGLVALNHASYGLATTELLRRAERLRLEIEADPDVRLGEPLGDRLLEVRDGVAARLGLDPVGAALTSGATSAAAAVQQSLPLSATDVVVTLDVEYASVLRGWRRRCAEAGARLLVVPVPLPLVDADELLERLDAAAGEQVTVLHVSAITSSTALQLPVARLAAWGRERGAYVVVDAAHVPGHLDVGPWDGVDVAFGTLHTWLPAPRAVGILWTRPGVAERIWPAEVSLTYDAPTVGGRFAWPGTYDPAPRLCLPAALDARDRWAADGALVTARPRRAADRRAGWAAACLPCGVPTVLLVRHGRSTANTAGVLAGRTPGVLLDDAGQRQAADLAGRLAPVPLAAVLSSPLERCRATAEAIVAIPGPRGRARRRPEVREEPGLLECDYGDWSGRPLRELTREPLWRVVQSHPSAVRFPGGESLREVQARAVETVRAVDGQLAADVGDHAVWVAVSHGDIIASVLADALGMHLDTYQRLVVDPCSVSAVRYTQTRPFVLRQNDTGGDLAALAPPRRRRRGQSRRSRDAAGPRSSEASEAVVGGGAGADPSGRG